VVANDLRVLLEGLLPPPAHPVTPAHEAHEGMGAPPPVKKVRGQNSSFGTILVTTLVTPCYQKKALQADSRD
jgi:hypothetical protein